MLEVCLGFFLSRSAWYFWQRHIEFMGNSPDFRDQMKSEIHVEARMPGLFGLVCSSLIEACCHPSACHLVESFLKIIDILKLQREQRWGKPLVKQWVSHVFHVFFSGEGKGCPDGDCRRRWVFLQCGLEEVMEPEGKRVEPGKTGHFFILLLVTQKSDGCQRCWWFHACLFIYYSMNIVWDEIPVIIVGRWSEIDYMAIDFQWLGITQLKQISTREIEVMDHHANEIAGVCPCCFLEGWKLKGLCFLVGCYVVLVAGVSTIDSGLSYSAIIVHGSSSKALLDLIYDLVLQWNSHMKETHSEAWCEDNEDDIAKICVFLGFYFPLHIYIYILLRTWSKCQLCPVSMMPCWRVNLLW